MIKRELKRVLLLFFGLLFVLFGLMGFAIPFVPGWFFLLIGIPLLSIASPAIRKRIERVTRKTPKIHAVVEKTEQWIVKVVGSPDQG